MSLQRSRPFPRSVLGTGSRQLRALSGHGAKSRLGSEHRRSRLGSFSRLLPGFSLPSPSEVLGEGPHLISVDELLGRDAESRAAAPAWQHARLRGRARTFVPYGHAYGTVIGSQPSRRYVVSTYKYKYTLATGPFAIADALTERCSAEATLSTQCRGGTIEVTIWKAQK